MQRTATTLALVALVALAGCSLPFAGSDAPGAGDATTAPGVTAEGITNETALLAAHVDALGAQSYETDIVINGTIIREEQSVEFSRHQQVLVAEGYSPYQYRVTETAGASTAQFDVWANESAQFVRVQSGGNTQYQRGNPQPPASLASASFIDTFVDDSYTVESTKEEDGHTYTTVTTDTAPDNVTNLVQGASDVSNFEGTIIVTEDGRVHAMSITMEYMLNGSKETMTVEYQLIQNGAPVEKPSWVSGGE
ncbi:DUF7537 family lipoprotein [Haladaptatus sp. ZSTT2]|uniref:DUF7537 family lipoprotein n=1 Tax=Haladaptatus sp. ZSTT2 TaxID=3120515 RepID=UPI00300EF37A